MIKGTDLAYCNENVDYDAMEDNGIRFACIKLGQGRLPKDPMFDIHTSNCDKRKIPWDLYWFCDYRYTGVENVRNLISKAQGNYGRKHVVCDLEFRSIWGYPDGAHMRRFALDFFGELEAQTSIVGMFYSNRDVINQISYQISYADKVQLLRHELWMATDAPYGNPAPWPKYKLNQYELDIAVPWCKEKVDLDEFNGTEEEFIAWENLQVPLDKTDIMWRELQLHYPDWNWKP